MTSTGPRAATHARIPIRILTVSTLFPNAVRPAHGIFVQQRLAKLVATGRVEARVIAPVPWFPSANPRFGRYAEFARVPPRDSRAGLEVAHPRYPLIPAVGMTVAPLGLASAIVREATRLRASGFDFDLIDAHYYYPDGVAAALAARRLGRPLVITARGTDISLVPSYRLPRRMVLWASRVAAHSISVCEALRAEMIAIGMDPARVTTLRNGVDLQRFVPVDRAEARQRIGAAPGRLLVSVGLLTERKSHDILIRALPALPGATAIIVGRGEQEGPLRELARALGVADRVRLEGEVAQTELKYFYSAADAMVLSSSREGWANVLLEAMACGTRVVASNVWGTPEVVARPEAGELMDTRTPEGLVGALARVEARTEDRAATRTYAEQFSWDATTSGQLEIFERVLGSRAA